MPAPVKVGDTAVRSTLAPAAVKAVDGTTALQSEASTALQPYRSVVAVPAEPAVNTTSVATPVVIELGGHNFRYVSRRGKALAIAVYNPDDEVRTTQFHRELKQYAVNGAHKDDYVFGKMDGKKWDKFLNQFSIGRDNLPELFVIDVPNRTYWQDASVFGIAEFIAAVKSGEIQSREQEKPQKGPLEEFLQVFVDYMPWSLFLMLALFLTVFWLALPKEVSDVLIPPPMPPPIPSRPEDESPAKKEEVPEDDPKTKKDQ